MAAYVSETAMEASDADRSAGDRVRLSVSLGDHDYDIEATVSVDDDDRNKEMKIVALSTSGDDILGTVSEGSVCSYRVLGFIFVRSQ